MQEIPEREIPLPEDKDDSKDLANGGDAEVIDLIGGGPRPLVNGMIDACSNAAGVIRRQRCWRMFGSNIGASKQVVHKYLRL